MIYDSRIVPLAVSPGRNTAEALQKKRYTKYFLYTWRSFRMVRLVLGEGGVHHRFGGGGESTICSQEHMKQEETINKTRTGVSLFSSTIKRVVSSGNTLFCQSTKKKKRAPVDDHVVPFSSFLTEHRVHSPVHTPTRTPP